MRTVLLVLLVLLPAPLAAQHIARAEALTPAEEQKTFKVPEGFEVQLVAADPDIPKPIQMAFDSRNRLWVTTSFHYPHAAPTGQAKDKLLILSDFDTTGKAKKIEVFAENLNIPIGILPLPDGKSCLVTECGRIIKLSDTNNDGKADTHEEILTGFGFDDTHGMTNSLLAMPDGWIYATHGFRNTSKINGKDGHVVTMQSGNTFRFRVDGSRVEQYTYGQVNPFGLCCDPWLNLYTADCHSKPITQLIPGAYYQSFGKPHDGLGFAPHVTPHDHGSTALCGLTWYDDPHFPQEYSGCMFLGNVVTNRINFDGITWKGSTAIAKELPDFLTSSDPWFRPTDVQLGPDGALYIADFYNKIIGHYEVDLKHPERDKLRGRIWRVVWKGKDNKAPPPAMAKARPDMSLYEVLTGLQKRNLTVRLSCFHELERRLTTDKENLATAVASAAPQNSHSLMTIYYGLLAFLDVRHPNRGLLPDTLPRLIELVKNATAEEKAQLTGTMIRAFGTRLVWSEADRKLMIASLGNYIESSRVVRAIVEGILHHPHKDFVPVLIALCSLISAEDQSLKHALKIALRNSLQSSKYPLAQVSIKDLPEDQLQFLLQASLSWQSVEADQLMVSQLARPTIPARLKHQMAEFLGRRTPPLTWKKVLAYDFAHESDAKTRQEHRLACHEALLRGVQAQARKLTPSEVRDLNKIFEQVVATSSPELIGQALRNYLLWTAVSKGVTQDHSAIYRSVEESLRDEKLPDQYRLSVMAYLNQLDPKRAKPFLHEYLKRPDLTPAGRASAYQEFLKTPPTEAEGRMVAEEFKTAPYTLALILAQGLAADASGTELLLQSIKKGEAPARLLQEPAILNLLKKHATPEIDQRIKSLTSGLASPDVRLAELIKKRVSAFPTASKDPIRGKEIFTKNCAVCHQLGGAGAKVGPQLDGIGIRGVERLMEDTLDPNRNVDEAFRATTFHMTDGRVLTGLLLRQDGQVQVLVDGTGKEHRIGAKDFEKQSTSRNSAMPSNLDTQISEADYFHLLAFLLQQKPK